MQKRKQDYLNEREQQQNTYFTPMINNRSKKMKRGVKELDNDSKRRHEARRSMDKLMQEKASIDASRAFINSKSDKVMFDRFDHDFRHACQKLKIDPDDKSLKIKCSQMSLLFLHTGFIKQESNEHEQNLLAQAWKHIGGDAEGLEEVYLHHAKVIMCCVQNFHIDWLIDEDGDREFNPAKLGRMDGEEIFFTPDEISYITKKYVIMYINRQDRCAHNLKHSHVKKAVRKETHGPTY